MSRSTRFISYPIILLGAFSLLVALFLSRASVIVASEIGREVSVVLDDWQIRDEFPEKVK